LIEADKLKEHKQREPSTSAEITIDIQRESGIPLRKS